MYHACHYEILYEIVVIKCTTLDIGPKSKIRIHELLQTLNKTLQFYKPVIRNQGVEDFVTDIMDMEISQQSRWYANFENMTSNTWLGMICINDLFLLYY